jgi:thiamine pyrophosphate-dependent acetolactate synthase large subunit-like protein
MIMSADSGKSIKTGADVVVRTLEAQGVKYVFGVPGA